VSSSSARLRATPEEVPGQIRAERRGNRDGQRHDNAQAVAVSRQRTSTSRAGITGIGTLLVGEKTQRKRQSRPPDGTAAMTDAVRVAFLRRERRIARGEPADPSIEARA